MLTKKISIKITEKARARENIIEKDWQRNILCRVHNIEGDDR